MKSRNRCVIDEQLCHGHPPDVTHDGNSEIEILSCSYAICMHVDRNEN